MLSVRRTHDLRKTYIVGDLMLRLLHEWRVSKLPIIPRNLVPAKDLKPVAYMERLGNLRS